MYFFIKIAFVLKKKQLGESYYQDSLKAQNSLLCLNSEYVAGLVVCLFYSSGLHGNSDLAGTSKPWSFHHNQELMSSWCRKTI